MRRNYNTTNNTKSKLTFFKRVSAIPIYLYMIKRKHWSFALTKHGILWAIFTFLCTLSEAQGTENNGAIKGVITDSDNKEVIIAASVYLEGSSGMYTDLNGSFHLQNIKPGKYMLKVSYLGYNTYEQEVVITANQTLTLNIELKAATRMLSTLEIKSERIRNTEQAVVFEIKNANQVASGLSKEQIKKSQDKDAAQVMQRIPGVTVVDNRFVMIRGLSERYNSILINNVMAPSTEVDKRTFSFDLISSSALDRMLIYKSGSADMPADFAGGVIKLHTVEQTENNYLRLNLNTGYRVGTTFSDYEQSEGSHTDYLGFDDGYRALPESFPSTFNFQNSPRNAQLREDFGRKLPNNFSTQSRTAMPDYGIGLESGNRFNAGKLKIVTLNQVHYSQSYQQYQREFNRYFEWVDQENPIIKRFEYVDNTYQHDVKVNVLSNWTIEINDRNKIKFKNLFNQLGENETIIRNGSDFIQRPNDDLRNYLLGYKGRTLYTGQLEGLHIVKPNHIVSWVAGLSTLNEDEPDLRRFRTFRPRSSSEEEGFQMQLPPSSNLFETGRYFGSLFDLSWSHGADYTIKLDEKKEGKTFNTGYYIDHRNRNFDSRYFSYLYPGFNDPTIGETLRRLPLDQIFAPENIRTRDGFILEEGTRPIDSYTAQNQLYSFYFNTILPINRHVIGAGLRLEYNIQSMNSQDDFSTIEVNNPILGVLPFLNYTYKLNPKTNLRAGYSKTLNRPEFREIAPFLFYDYKYEAGRVGQPDLRTAFIDNLDIRYEYYPRGGETVSVGVFYKNFKDPIENRTIVTTEQPTFSFINADRAYNYGAELELRKALDGLTRYGFVDHLSVNLNMSYIFSQVDLGETAVAQDRVRPLQGQSPYIINAAVSYNNNNKDLQVTTTYNIFGDRIFSVGDVIFPTIYELSRHSLDLTINKNIGKKFILKMGVQDILNYPFRFYEDSDRNEKINSLDNPIVVFRRGSLYSLSISYLIK